MKIAINGFGRIGRAFFRHFYQTTQMDSKCGLRGDNPSIAESSEDLNDDLDSSLDNWRDLEIVQINDVCDFDKLMYLLKEDSVYGRFACDFTYSHNTLEINGKSITLSAYANPSDFRSDADIVLECSGKFDTTNALQPYIDHGASYVILGTTPKDNMSIFIYGVNEDKYDGEKIISNASCTSNAIAPIVRTINEKHKIKSGNISIIHPFNNDQSLLDSPHRDSIRLSRNATINIIPTSSSIGGVLKGLFDIDFYGDSLRIPTSIVAFSNIDLVFDKPITKDILLDLAFDSKIIGIDNDMRVSSDFVGDSRSAIIASDLININGNIARIGIWFDNESGYANRLLDMLRVVCRYHQARL